MNSIIEFLNEQLRTNEFFQGGAIIAILAALWSWLRTLPELISGWIKYHLMVEIDIPSTDPAFDWINKWLANHEYTKNRARRLTLKTQMATAHDEDGLPHLTRNVEEGDELILSPGPGHHYIWDNWRLIILERRRNTGTEGNSRQKFLEFFSIKIVGRNRKPAFDLIRGAQNTFITPNTIEVKEAMDGGYWTERSCRAPRSLNSIILDSDVKDTVLADISDFLINRAWYIERGIPYRRNYLFYGPPGNGKTSLIIGLASEFKMSIYITHLLKLTNADLIECFSIIPPGSLVVIEDIDCIFQKHNKKVKITLEGLINALDGILSAEGYIVVMTTNNEHLLPEVLTRPGRMDLKIKFNNATSKQAYKMFKNFYPDAGKDITKKFSDSLPENISMAKIQRHLIEHKYNPEKALETISQLTIKDFEEGKIDASAN